MPIKRLAILPQYLVPQHGLSRLVGGLTNCRHPKVKNWCIRRFLKTYPVNMEEALNSDPYSYPDFNSFFTRLLKPGIRTLVKGKNQIACPVDGCISQIGKIEDGRIIQAKGFDFDVTNLLGGSKERAQAFRGGSFATIYLAPQDYHRVHMPLTGSLHEMIHVPGHLFSVNPRTACHVSALFARNERLVALFETTAGPMAVILVGAMLVASINTVWAGEVNLPQQEKPRAWNYSNEPFTLSKGEEMGHFKLGSTVILLFGANAINWSDELQAGSQVQMGQLLGEIN